MHDVQATVRLTDDEFARVKAFSDRIHAANRRRRRRHRQGWKPRGKEAVDARVSGYCAEFAFAKFLGVEWHAFGVDADHFRERPDVGGYDVKSTDLITGRLIVTPHDADDRVCVLVIAVDRLRYDIVGCFRAGDAKRDEWFELHRESGGAWYVPRDLMKPVLMPRSTIDDHRDELRRSLGGIHPDDEDRDAERLDNDLARHIESLGPVERGDWRAVLRAQGIPEPERRDDVNDERQR